MSIREGLVSDSVLLVPVVSTVYASGVKGISNFTKPITSNTLLLSSVMETVTEKNISSLNGSHTHKEIITKDSPNYRRG